MLIQALVVDPEIAMRHAVVIELDRLGIKSDSAATGLEAMRRVREYDYRLILLNLNMTEMDGFEVAAAVRSFETRHAKSKAPIIAIAVDGDKQACLDSGMQDLVSKKDLIKELPALVEKWMLPKA
jgi:CheY-like chemotaxis protein